MSKLCGDREYAESVEEEDCATEAPSEKYVCSPLGANPLGGVKTDEELAAESKRAEDDVVSI